MGVLPFLSVKKGSAPRRSRIFTAVTFPNAAAMCNGVGELGPPGVSIARGKWSITALMNGPIALSPDFVSGELKLVNDKMENKWPVV
jgi:hypothetical protein